MPMTTIRPLRGQRLEVAGEVGSADQLEDDVEGAVLREALGVDDLVGAQLGDVVAQALVAHGGGDVGAGRGAELDAGGAHPAGGAVDEQALAGAQAGLREERVVGGGEDLGHAAGLGPAQVRRAPA